MGEAGSTVMKTVLVDVESSVVVGEPSSPEPAAPEVA